MARESKKIGPFLDRLIVNPGQVFEVTEDVTTTRGEPLFIYAGRHYTPLEVFRRGGRLYAVWLSDANPDASLLDAHGLGQYRDRVLENWLRHQATENGNREIRDALAASDVYVVRVAR